MATFVFFHVGNDLTWPTRMVASIHAHNVGAEVIQVTDHDTPTVEGVTWTVPTTGDPRYLMQWRVDAFASLSLDAPALYMDTDMIVRRPIEPTSLLGWADILMPRRTFNREAIFNIHQRGQSYAEHAGKTLDEVYPYVGCATVTPDSRPWEDMAEMFFALPEHYRVWYGDQEVLREYAKGRRVGELPEHYYACLPEFLPEHPNPYIVHYKGQRKALFTADTRAESQPSTDPSSP